MKPLKLLSMSILIASALLLSAAKGVNALPPNPSKRDRTAQPQAQRTSDKKSAATQPCPAVTVVIQQIPPANQTQRITAVIQDKPYKHWWDAQNAPEWALFILTIPYVVITGGLLCANLKAISLAKQSADAASKNAETAELAFYTTTRPWVLVSDFKIGLYDSGPTVTYKVYNAGPLPALLHGIEIVAEASAIDPLRYSEHLPPVVTRVIAIHVPPHTDTNNGFIIQDFRPSLTHAEWHEIRAGNKWLYCYGLVRYLGPLNELWLYTTGFGAWHQGEWAVTPVAMSPMLDRKVNYLK